MHAEVQLIIDYVEGRSSIDSFQDAFLHDPKLRKILKKKFDLSRTAYKKYNFNLYDFFNGEYRLARGTWNNIASRYIVWSELTRWLEFHNYSFVACNKYRDDYVFLLDILPTWLDNYDDQGIFDIIVSQIPTDIPKGKRVAMGKQMVKDRFKYDKTYPRWIQGAEWPIIDGKPLVFRRQSEDTSDSDTVKYYFYDPDTNEEYIVEQLF